MANVTRIKAKDDGRNSESSASDDADITRKVTVKAKKSENKKVRAKEAAEAKKAAKAEKKAAKKAAREGKKVFILFRPFVALGRYIRDSFRELRQVRWPDRKSTWKMTFSVILYVILIATFIMLLDALFTFIFNLILKQA
ncbi:preprotein translocase subunit SecE [Candidatus Saccharibacteria bacterium]|nr:preprotein translocase subunit SecE [Candidatus Saccharibacteria bacterium]